MSDPKSTLTVRFAAACDIGMVRDTNEDAAYASDRLLAVADGVRGPSGAAASTAAIDALKALDLADVSAVELLAKLAAAVTDADRSIRETANGHEQPATTLTALLRSGSQLALVHVGDTRIYLLRGGELFQLTQDHTWVQTQVDQGKLDRGQAEAHPQRALLVRALGGGGRGVEADLALRTALPGDRYLLTTPCSS
jgi:serine/threonine protein phosphatase PrpC